MIGHSTESAVFNKQKAVQPPVMPRGTARENNLARVAISSSHSPLAVGRLCRTQQTSGARSVVANNAHIVTIQNLRRSPGALG